MANFRVTTADGKRLYLKKFNKADETLEFTEDRNRDELYSNSDGFFANADKDFIKFHFADKYPFIDTLECC